MTLSPYVYKERMDLISNLVTVKLGNKFFYTVEFQFRTGAAHKGKTHRLLINVSIKPEYMDLNTAIGAVLQRRSVANA